MKTSDLSKEKLEQLLNQGEGFTIEYKKCKDSISESVFETVCSFSNRYGGYILLGVEEDKKTGKGLAAGVEKKSVQKIKKDFINTLNNPTKFSPSLFLSLEEVEYKKKTLLWVYVPISSEVESCGHEIFDRNGDADQKITKSTDLVANLYSRKSHAYFESQIFPYVTEEHLRMDLIPKIKQLALVRNENHPWNNLSDMELFRSAGLYEENLITGQKGFNLAAILLFGKDTTIHSCLPAYRTDAIFRDKNFDRYDDRLIVDTNLIESYELLMNFIAKHTDDKFFLIDNVNTSVRNIIAREIVSNILAHRDYSSAFPAKMIITKDQIYTENWNRAITFGKIKPEHFTPYPKNPVIANFFMNIGRADTLGSGVRNLYKYTKIYSNSEPTLDEDDVFTITIPLIADEKNSNSTHNKSNSLSNEEKILVYIKENGSITTPLANVLLNYNSRTAGQKLLSKMVEEKTILKVGNGKATKYIIVQV